MLYIITYIAIPVSFIGLLWFREFGMAFLLLGIHGIVFNALSALDDVYLGEIRGIKEEISKINDTAEENEKHISSINRNVSAILYEQK